MGKILESIHIKSIFDGSKFEPELFKQVKLDYLSGNKYLIKKWTWTGGKIIDKIINCSTIEIFELELWDIFAEFASKNGYALTWGPFGLEHRNPHKNNQIYCDGLVYALVHKEFLDCIINQDIPHFLSCLIHFGYNLDFECVAT